MIDPGQIHEGMIVRSPQGETLGRVLSCEEGEFTVGRSFVFIGDYVARYEDVTHVAGEEVQLSRSREELARVEREPDVPTHPEIEAPSYGEEGGAGRP